jgi:hypothetical protein
MGLQRTDDQDEVFVKAKELGITTVIDPSSDKPLWESAAGVAQIAAGLNAAAEKAAV